MIVPQRFGEVNRFLQIFYGGRGASGGFLFSREKEPKRALEPLYALVGAKASRTVTGDMRVGLSIYMESPTGLSVGADLCVRPSPTPAAPRGYCNPLLGFIVDLCRKL